MGATANRRLTALMMYQGLSRSRVVPVECNIRSLHDPRWHDKLLGDGAGRSPALSSTSSGLDIGFHRKRNAVASHYGFSLFDIEHTAYYVLQKLFAGAPNEHQVMGSVRLEVRRRRDDYDEYELRRTIDGRTLAQAWR